MKTLSKIGRKWICWMVGITDINSIFIENQEAFLDRMNLLSEIYDMQLLTDIYKEELSNYNNEEEYNAYLISRLQYLNTLIEDTVSKACAQMQELGISVTQYQQNEIITSLNETMEIESGSSILRIYSSQPIYDGFRYLVGEMTDIELPSTINCFVCKHTKSKYLKQLFDLRLEDFSNNTAKILETSMKNISMSIFSLISPRSISTRQIMHIGKTEVYYNIINSLNIRTIDNMINTLRNVEELPFEEINMQLFNVINASNNSRILAKDLIYANESESAVDSPFIECDEPSFIAYLRHIKSEEPSEYDKYFMYKGNEVKMNSKFVVDWID